MHLPYGGDSCLLLRQSIKSCQQYSKSHLNSGCPSFDQRCCIGFEHNHTFRAHVPYSNNHFTLRLATLESQKSKVCLNLSLSIIYHAFDLQKPMLANNKLMLDTTFIQKVFLNSSIALSTDFKDKFTSTFSLMKYGPSSLLD